MEHKPLIAGNWKMHKTHLEAIQIVQKLHYRLDSRDFERVEVMVAPPFTALRSVQTVIEADRLRIAHRAALRQVVAVITCTGGNIPTMVQKEVCQLLVCSCP